MAIKLDRSPSARTAPHLPSLPSLSTPAPTAPGSWNARTLGGGGFHVSDSPRYPTSIRMGVSRAWQGTGPVAQRAWAPPPGAPFSPPRPSDQKGHSQSRAVPDPLPRDALSKDDGGAGKTLPQPLTSQTSIALPNPPVSLCPQTRPQPATGCPRGWSGAEAPAGLEKPAH